MVPNDYIVVEKELEPALMAGYKMQGRYRDCGKGFGKVGRSFGRHICGPGFLLIYDTEYREDDASFECCMPVKQGEDKGDVSVRILEGGDCIAVTHLGPYEEISGAYEAIISFAEKHDLQLKCPSREVYLKGPGMFFKGNPKKYVTEVQFLIDQG